MNIGFKDNRDQMLNITRNRASMQNGPFSPAPTRTIKAKKSRNPKATIDFSNVGSFIHVAKDPILSSAREMSHKQSMARLTDNTLASS